MDPSEEHDFLQYCCLSVCPNMRAEGKAPSQPESLSGDSKENNTLCLSLNYFSHAHPDPRGETVLTLTGQGVGVPMPAPLHTHRAAHDPKNEATAKVVHFLILMSPDREAVRGWAQLPLNLFPAVPVYFLPASQLSSSRQSPP